MLNDLFRTYKKIIILVLIILCMIIFWFYGCHRQQHVSESGQTWEEEELSGGGSGYHFRQSFCPAMWFWHKRVSAAGQDASGAGERGLRGTDFTGTLKITLPGADNEGVSYQSAVYCRQGADSRVEMEVPDLGSASYFYFEILDSFGTVVFSEKVQTRENEELAGAREIYVGVLSDRYSDLEYMMTWIWRSTGRWRQSA